MRVCVCTSAHAKGCVCKPYQEGRAVRWARAGTLSPQRAIRVRSHSMETMVSSQKKQHSGGIPGSLSGGISHNSMEVTKTTFSVSLCGPWAAHGSWGGSPGLWRKGAFTQV